MQRQADAAVQRFKSLIDEKTRINFSPAESVRRAVLCKIIIVLVDFVIAAEVHTRPGGGIPADVGGIFLEEARVVGCELHRRGAKTGNLRQSAVFMQIPLAFG